VHNQYARLRHTITAEEFEKSAMIATPINLLDASPIGDGAAAVYIVPADSLLPGNRILVAASTSATDTIAIHDRKEPLFLAGLPAGRRGTG
jgi:acetyl-CoA C-acetyltransferase